MTSRGKPPAPPADDDPSDDWTVPHPGDTVVDLDPSELRELEADATTPTVGPEAMPGYELGRHHERAAFFRKWDAILAQQENRGAARVLQALRDQMAKEGNHPDFIDAVVERLAHNAGVKLG